MSEQKMRSVTDSTRKSRQTVKPYQPVWMAHWIRPSSNTAPESCNLRACGNEELNCVSRDRDLLNVLDVSLPVKELGKVETKIFGTVKSLENETMCQSPMNNGRETVDKEALGPAFFQTLERGKAIDWKTRVQLSSGSPAVNGTSFTGHNSRGEGTSKNPLDWMKAHSSAKERSFTQSKLNHETIAGTSKHSLPHYNLEKYKFNKGKAVVSPFIVTPSDVSNDHLPNVNMIMVDQENCNQQNHSTNLTCGRKMRFDNSKGTVFRGINMPLLSDAPSTSDHHLTMVGHESFQKMQERSGISVPPSQFIASEKAETKKSCYNFISLQKLPNCVHDMETMRICTTVDSVEANLGCFPRFSQTTHRLLITKKTNANLSKEVFGTTQLMAELNQNTSPEIHSLLPFSGHGNRGVKLQPLSSSSNSEEKINARDVKASKVAIRNESSAETEIMDLDFVKDENSNPVGANYTPSTKTDFNCPRDPTHGWTNTSLPDINLELPALPVVASTSGHACASSSRTQSLEMDMLLEYAEQPKRKSTQFLDDFSEPDPITRWVKRLKLRSSSSSSQDARSQMLAENSSPDRMGRYLRRIIDSGIGSSETIPSSYPSKELIPVSLKKDKESLLSHTWIKRWLQNGSGAAQKKPEDIVCEPKRSKLTQDNSQNKKCPSIAAMALMGKALNGLQPCELQKGDSFTVWNTPGILKTP